jgi:hypothetical protein
VVGSNNLSSIALSDTGDAVGILEVEDEVSVRQESLALDSVGSQDELLEKGEAASSGCCGGGSHDRWGAGG